MFAQIDSLLQKVKNLFMMIHVSSFGTQVYKSLRQVCSGEELSIQSQNQISATFNELRQHTPLSLREPDSIMVGILKRLYEYTGMRNNTVRAGLTGPLVRKCHTFRRDGYIVERNFNTDGYEADRDERRELFTDIRRRLKTIWHAERENDRETFRNLHQYTCDIKGNREFAEVFPYAGNDKTFENTVANIALFRAQRAARRILFKAQGIVIKRRRRR